MIDVGYVRGGTLEGVNYFINVGINGEEVFDLYTFETGWFVSGGFGGTGSFGGSNVKGYAGIVLGWSNFRDSPDIQRYSGRYISGAIEVGLNKNVGVGLTGAASTDENYMMNDTLYVVGVYASAGPHVWPFPASASVTARGNTRLVEGSRRVFRSGSRPTFTDAQWYALDIMAKTTHSIHTRIAMSSVVLYNGRAWDTQP